MLLGARGRLGLGADAVRQEAASCAFENLFRPLITKAEEFLWSTVDTGSII